MKKVASILLCVAIFLSLCTPASATATETEPQDFDQLPIGNIVILVDPSWEAEQASENLTRIQVSKGKTIISVLVEDISSASDGMKKYMPKFQQAALITNAKNGEDVDIERVERSILEETVEFEEFDAKDGIFWSIGTFFDDDFIYSLMYCSTENSDEDMQKFEDFISLISIAEDEK